MAEFKIKDEDLASLKGKIVVLTGGSSGIGLATTQLLLSLGASVVAGDLKPSPVTHANLTSLETNVASWPALLTLFKTAVSKHGRIDHVFANAGRPPVADYFSSTTDENGDLVEPTNVVFDVMLRGMINTSYLGLHHLRTQQPAGGSIVITASASSFQRFRATDYTTAKHGALGFMRGIVPRLTEKPEFNVRINAIAPSWTATGILSQALLDALGDKIQGPEVVARNVALLFADGGRQGELHYSAEGRFFEVEEAILLPAAVKITGSNAEEEGLSTFAKTNRLV